MSTKPARSNLTGGEASSSFPEAPESSAVGAVCDKDSCQLDGTFLLLKGTNQLLKILRS